MFRRPPCPRALVDRLLDVQLACGRDHILDVERDALAEPEPSAGVRQQQRIPCGRVLSGVLKEHAKSMARYDALLDGGLPLLLRRLQPQPALAAETGGRIRRKEFVVHRGVKERPNSRVDHAHRSRCQRLSRNAMAKAPSEELLHVRTSDVHQSRRAQRWGDVEPHGVGMGRIGAGLESGRSNLVEPSLGIRRHGNSRIDRWREPRASAAEDARRVGVVLGRRPRREARGAPDARRVAVVDHPHATALPNACHYLVLPWRLPSAPRRRRVAPGCCARGVGFTCASAS